MDKIFFFARILTTYDQLQKWCWPITTLIILILSATATLYLQQLSTASVTSSIASKASETLSTLSGCRNFIKKNNIFESFMYSKGKLCFSNSIPNFIILNIPNPNCISTILTALSASVATSTASWSSSTAMGYTTLSQALWTEQLQELLSPQT